VVTEASTGIEFWQDCAPPEHFKIVEAKSDRSGTMIGPGGVEYRRVHTTRSQQQTGKPAFIWQRKMWRMLPES